MSENLEGAFEGAMYGIYRNAKVECNYTAGYFYQMLVNMGGVATAKRLLNDDKIHDGFTRLWECGRLDLTLEAEVWENAKWHPLFTDSELRKAEQCLRDLNYFK